MARELQSRLTDEPCPKCGSALLCQFDEYRAPVGDDTFTFTHRCSSDKCDYVTERAETIGQNQENGGWDYLCSICGYDWLHHPELEKKN